MKNDDPARPRPEVKFPTLSEDDWRRSLKDCRARENVAFEQIKAEAARRKVKK